MNSPFKDNIVCDHLRYINWTFKNGSCPAILDEEDYEKIKKRKLLMYKKNWKAIKGIVKFIRN